jgi:hypothetical protein
MRDADDLSEPFTRLGRNREIAVVDQGHKICPFSICFSSTLHRLDCLLTLSTVLTSRRDVENVRDASCALGRLACRCGIVGRNSCDVGLESEPIPVNGKDLRTLKLAKAAYHT